MSELFDDSLKTCFEYAFQLKEAHKYKLARDIGIKCARYAAVYNGIDMLCLFYGTDQIYSAINNVADAVVYAFIAKCAAKVYARICSKNEAASKSNPWLTKNVECDFRLKDAFKWLSKRKDRVAENDFIYFEEILKAYNVASSPNYNLSARIERMRPLDVIRGIVLNSVQVSENGGLL